MFDIKDVKDPCIPCAVCCLLVISYVLSLLLNKTERIAVIAVTVSVWTSPRQDYAEFMSGLAWGVRNAAKCNSVQKHLSTPAQATLVPPNLCGMFQFTHLILITSLFCKQTKTGFLIERMNYMTLVTFPHLPALCCWKTLCHGMTSKNFPMKERFFFFLIH